MSLATTFSMMEMLMKKATVKDQSYSTIGQQPSKMSQKGSPIHGKKLLQEKFELPTPKVYLYNAEGNPAGELIYPLQANSYQHSTGSHRDYPRENSGDNMEESIGEEMRDSTWVTPQERA